MSSASSINPNIGRPGRVVALPPAKEPDRIRIATDPDATVKRLAYPTRDCPTPRGIDGDDVPMITTVVSSKMGLRERLLLLLSGQCITRVNVTHDVDSGQCASESVLYPEPPPGTLSCALEQLIATWQVEFPGVDTAGVRATFCQLLGIAPSDATTADESPSVKSDEQPSSESGIQ